MTAPVDFTKVRSHLQRFAFGALFIDELGWSHPRGLKPVALTVKGTGYIRTPIAELSGVVVFEVTGDDGVVPHAKVRAEIQKQTGAQHYENVLVFVDAERSQSLWSWTRRDGKRAVSRDHLFVRGQPGDLFIGKLARMVFDLTDFDAKGNVPVVEVAKRLRSALDVEQVTKRFFAEFQTLHSDFATNISGIADERQRTWYAQVQLHRLMFVTFLQKRGFLDGGAVDYLQDKLAESQRRGPDRYYSEFLKALFFEGFAKPEADRSPEVRARIGRIVYLNGGLFLRHPIEEVHGKIAIPDAAFERLFAFFNQYSWHLDDTPGAADNQISPDVLGYIFEKYINQKAFGAYYTRPEITDYLCERTIHPLILDRVNEGFAEGQTYGSMDELLLELDAETCRRLLIDILPKLSVLDPACGSGAFLVAAMKTLINVYAAVIEPIDSFKDALLLEWQRTQRAAHRSVAYAIKKAIITDNLYGVDIMEEATEVCKLRLFLALVGSVDSVEDLEPLPNVDFNIQAGNSLIGLLRVNDADFERKGTTVDMFRPRYREIVETKDQLVARYRHHDRNDADLLELRHQIESYKRQAKPKLDEILLEEFSRLGIKYEQATWDTKKGAEGKPVKRALRIQDIEALKPFHWGYEFDEVLGKRGGFDVILTNPPWEVFQTDEKEFFQRTDDTIRKKKIAIEDWKTQRVELMKEPAVRDAWLGYASGYPHVAAYFKGVAQFEAQRSVDSAGDRIASKINLYSYFVEQCYRLLRPGGRTGVITPAGLYGDLSTKQLRVLLFSYTHIDQIFGLSNERYLFEGVDHRVKFCLATFARGGSTETFEAAFRINPREAIGVDMIEAFLNDHDQHVSIRADSIARISPDTLSVPEFKHPLDVVIAEKTFEFERLNQAQSSSWKLRLTQEFNMTTDSGLFRGQSGMGRLPLFEGKVIHQYNPSFGAPKYWLEEAEAREKLLSSRRKAIQRILKAHQLEATLDEKRIVLDYEQHRLAFRDVARNTDERTLIATILPRNVFCPHTMSLESVFRDEVVEGELRLNVRELDDATRFYLLAIFNSFVIDFLLRQRVTAHVSFFFVYNLPVPRLGPGEAVFQKLVLRAARLTCITPEFDDLAKSVGLKDHRVGAIEFADRAQLRAEIDGLVAHLYGLTEPEFVHVLSTFPVVPEPVKVAAHNAYRDVARGLIS